MGAADPTNVNQLDARFKAQDHAFVALIDGAFANAAMRSGSHLLCRPGCTQCCIGVFAVGPADALRLRQGLSTLKQTDPERAARVKARAALSWSRLEATFPGDAASGMLSMDNSEPADSFDDFANAEPCPALDPVNGTCDLYSARPQTCRVFGPPIATDEGYGVCELCFQTATVADIAKAAIALPAEEISDSLDQAAVLAGESSGSTIVAFVLSAE